MVRARSSIRGRPLLGRRIITLVLPSQGAQTKPIAQTPAWMPAPVGRVSGVGGDCREGDGEQSLASQIPKGGINATAKDILPERAKPAS